MMNFIIWCIRIAFYAIIVTVVTIAAYGVIEACRAEHNPKDYGKCGFIRHHKVIKNKNGQYVCKYCGRTKLSLDKEFAKNKKLPRRK